MVGRLGFQEVDAGADVGVRTRGDELERKSVTRGGDTVCSSVVRTIQSAVL